MRRVLPVLSCRSMMAKSMTATAVSSFLMGGMMNVVLFGMGRELPTSVPYVFIPLYTFLAAGWIGQWMMLVSAGVGMTNA